MSNPRIAEYGKATQIKKGEVRNKTGQPRKGISLFIKQCEDAGIEQANKKDIEATYLTLVNMSADELKGVLTDKIQPEIVKKLAQFIIEAKDINIFETILDRGIGKVKETIEQTTNVKLDTSDLDNKPLEEVTKLLQDLINKK